MGGITLKSCISEIESSLLGMDLTENQDMYLTPAIRRARPNHSNVHNLNNVRRSL
jgi:hypothetical protein